MRTWQGAPQYSTRTTPLGLAVQQQVDGIAVHGYALGEVLDQCDLLVGEHGFALNRGPIRKGLGLGTEGFSGFRIHRSAESEPLLVLASPFENPTVRATADEIGRRVLVLDQPAYSPGIQQRALAKVRQQVAREILTGPCVIFVIWFGRQNRQVDVELPVHDRSSGVRLRSPTYICVSGESVARLHAAPPYPAPTKYGRISAIAR